MKYLILITMSLLSFQSIKAQTDSIEIDLYNTILIMDGYLTDADKTLQLANKFEQIGEIKKDSWLLYYYASYCYVMAAFLQTDTKKIDPLAEKAEILLNRAELFNKKDSEITCLRSLIASARIMVNPNSRGMKFGMIASQMLNKAKLENPNNPRVYYLEAQSLMFMPEEYGGGCKNAKPLLKIAIEKYDKFKMESKIHPNWGNESVIKLLGECNN
ncbi:MAG: hypothetical protein ACI8P3_004206 [Saprospiraceae bacterium]|jgi:hypothetical protein